jgi:hypothetical protein
VAHSITWSIGCVSMLDRSNASESKACMHHHAAAACEHFSAHTMHATAVPVAHSITWSIGCVSMLDRSNASESKACMHHHAAACPRHFFLHHARNCHARNCRTMCRGPSTAAQARQPPQHMSEKGQSRWPSRLSWPSSCVPFTHPCPTEASQATECSEWPVMSLHETCMVAFCTCDD